MNYSLAIPLSGQPVYVNGMAPADDFGLDRQIEQEIGACIINLQFEPDPGAYIERTTAKLIKLGAQHDHIGTLSDRLNVGANYKGKRPNTDEIQRWITAGVRSVGGYRISGIPENRVTATADIAQARDGTLRQSPPDKRPAFDWKSAALKSRLLCDRRYPQMRAILPGLIPEGVMLLAARPKIGKTWMLQQLGCAVGGNHAGTLGVQARQGDVMMLTLEDGERRTQARLTKYFGANSSNWPERVTLTASWRRLDQGGVQDLREWCKSVQAPTLITIDTLKRVRAPKNKSQTDYDADYDACRPLIELSHEFPGLGIVCAVHDRKAGADDVFDTVSGTLGLTGGVDAIAIIKRTAQGFTLHVEGRDLETVVEKAIDFDRETCRWQVLGDVSAMPPTDTKGRVIAALNAVGQPMSIDALLKATGIPKRNTLDKALSRMTKDGDIRRTDSGMYAV